jgi:hypothetical protein
MIAKLIVQILSLVVFSAVSVISGPRCRRRESEMKIICKLQFFLIIQKIPLFLTNE